MGPVGLSGVGAHPAVDAWEDPERVRSAEVDHREAARASERARMSAADRAVELLMAGEVQRAGEGIATATTALRRAAARRIDARAKIRQILERLEQAQADRSWWQKLCDGLGVLGKVLAALGAVATVVATAGVGGAAVAATALALASAGAGLGGALGGLGVGSYQRDLLRLEADRLAQDDAGRMARTEMQREEAFAQALVAQENAMRERALRWVGLAESQQRIVADLAGPR